MFSVIVSKQIRYKRRRDDAERMRGGVKRGRVIWLERVGKRWAAIQAGIIDELTPRLKPMLHR